MSKSIDFCEFAAIGLKATATQPNTESRKVEVRMICKLWENMYNQALMASIAQRAALLSKLFPHRSSVFIYALALNDTNTDMPH
jgi:hypothetical protein